MFSKKSMSELMITGRNGKRRREESWESTRYIDVYVMMTCKEYLPYKEMKTFDHKTIDNKIKEHSQGLLEEIQQLLEQNRSLAKEREEAQV